MSNSGIKHDLAPIDTSSVIAMIENGRPYSDVADSLVW